MSFCQEDIWRSRLLRDFLPPKSGHLLDTFGFWLDSRFLDNTDIILYNQYEVLSAEVAELADAQDLKNQKPPKLFPTKQVVSIQNTSNYHFNPF